MSSSELISPSKLLYSRDFLIRYSSSPHKDEPQLAQGETKKDNSLKKSVPIQNTSNPPAASYRLAKTPNPRKTGTLTVYSQKENVPTQTPPVQHKPGGNEGVASFYATPLRKALTPRTTGAPTFRSPVRKTWVTANSSLSTSSLEPANSSASSLSSVSVPEFQMTKDFMAASNPNILYSSSETERDRYPPVPGSPARIISAYSEPAIYLSPKSSYSSSSTPFKSPMSPGSSSKYSPNKSPARPISPLDEARLAQRQKQIDYGYRTVGYLRYRLLVTKDQRKAEHPRTPKKTQGCSKRSWDGQLKKWRRDLHLWDPVNTDAFKALLNSDLVVSIIAANPELAEIVDIVREKLDNPSLVETDDEFSLLDLITPATPASSFPGTTPQGKNDGFTKSSPAQFPGNLAGSKEDAGNKAPSKVARTLVFN